MDGNLKYWYKNKIKFKPKQMYTLKTKLNYCLKIKVK